MHTKTDRLTALPLPATAANGDFPKAAAPAEKPLRPRVAGWDPYEVWRTRVRSIQDAPAAQSAAAGD
jgi:hypothetical protein